MAVGLLASEQRAPGGLNGDAEPACADARSTIEGRGGDRGQSLHGKSLPQGRRGGNLLRVQSLAGPESLSQGQVRLELGIDPANLPKPGDRVAERVPDRSRLQLQLRQAPRRVK